MEEPFAEIILVAFALTEFLYLITIVICKRYPQFIIFTFLFNMTVLGGGMALKNYLLSSNVEDELQLKDLNLNEDVTNLYMLGLLLCNTNFIVSQYVYSSVTIVLIWSIYYPILGLSAQMVNLFIFKTTLVASLSVGNYFTCLNQVKLFLSRYEIKYHE